MYESIYLQQGEHYCKILYVKQCLTRYYPADTVENNHPLFYRAFSSNFSGQNWEKKIDLTSKLGEINDIEHYKGSKIYTQNQVILDCIMQGIPLKH